MKVAVALIQDPHQRLLITQRPRHAPHGGFWEFPGGKLETNERAEDALVREIKEELGIKIQQFAFLGEVKHDYPDKTIQFYVYLITAFIGTPTCLEGQLNMKWADVNSIHLENFPAANEKMLALYSRQCR